MLKKCYFLSILVHLKGNLVPCMNPRCSGALETHMTVRSAGFCICTSDVVKRAEHTESQRTHALRKHVWNHACPKFFPIA